MSGGDYIDRCEYVNHEVADTGEYESSVQATGDDGRTVEFYRAADLLAWLRGEDDGFLVPVGSRNDAEQAGLAADVIHDLLIVEPVITGHLTKLRMDTDEDNELLDGIRGLWAPVAQAVRSLRAALPSSEDGQ